MRTVTSSGTSLSFSLMTGGTNVDRYELVPALLTKVFSSQDVNSDPKLTQHPNIILDGVLPCFIDCHTCVSAGVLKPSPGDL